MLTKNFYRGLSVGVAPAGASCTGVDYSGSIKTMYNAGGNYDYIHRFGSCSSFVKSGASEGVAFGTGDTAPTLDDYTLSGSFITTANASYTRIANFYDEGMTLTRTYTITNTGSADITIKEVAQFARIVSSSSTSSWCYYMVDRTLLDEPVTIPAGGVGQVTYTITMDYPTE